MAKKKRHPYWKFYTRDWRAHPGLKRCTLAARGLWIDLLTIMRDEGKPFGHLRLNGKQPSLSDLSQMVGAPELEIKNALENLEKNAVFSRKKDGTIYSRRLVRDYEKDKKDRENGGLGGNPKLACGVNPPVKPLDKAIFHIPDSILSGKEQQHGRVENGFGGRKKKAAAQLTTIKDPQERLRRFQARLLPELGSGGAAVLAAANDPGSPDHAKAVRQCRDAAARMNKRWPTQWPTNGT